MNLIKKVIDRCDLRTFEIALSITERESFEMDKHRIEFRNGFVRIEFRKGLNSVEVNDRSFGLSSVKYKKGTGYSYVCKCLKF